ncbi:hypothetical protein ACFL4N_03640 [Thermodesulfobacteriota bacterium]
MENIKISLKDNDQVVRLETDFSMNGHEDPFRSFLQQINEEMIPGQTAYLEIDGLEKGHMTLEISHFE